jgi:hypothetical protein
MMATDDRPLFHGIDDFERELQGKTANDTDVPDGALDHDDTSGVMATAGTATATAGTATAIGGGVAVMDDPAGEAEPGDRNASDEATDR